MPVFNPPAWTYTEGWGWPYYYYFYHDILGLENPFTFYMGQFGMSFPWAWALIGLLLIGISAAVIYEIVKYKSFNPKYSVILAPNTIGLIVWGHVVERCVH